MAVVDGGDVIGGYRVRPMRLDDIDQVAHIEKQSFPLPWPADAYRRDLRGNQIAHYLVCERASELSELVGYIGYWLIQGEIHISTLAVHPDSRGYGLGECLLASALFQGMAQGGESALLEVRVSNLIAQGLYQKYGFRVTGRRRRYYRDNDEDALVMELPSMSEHSFKSLLRDHYAILTRRLEDAQANTELR